MNGVDSLEAVAEPEEVKVGLTETFGETGARELLSAAEFRFTGGPDENGPVILFGLPIPHECELDELEELELSELVLSELLLSWLLPLKNVFWGGDTLSGGVGARVPMVWSAA